MILTIKQIRPVPTTTLFNLRLSGKWGSLIPVIGFFSKNGAFAANSGRGRSSSSLNPMQSQWWARLAFFRFQYSKNVTAEIIQKFNLKILSYITINSCENRHKLFIQPHLQCFINPFDYFLWRTQVFLLELVDDVYIVCNHE